ncbi:MAG: hypothetical protein COA96_16975 [SAR86 cluster bacterium]|uniref:Uncharacterized protein n=1 Tax=SAR86 cluster bacterium TaxID=2030880 RepID=A0A2A5AG51_9GAMM|nr:MAG: hypothetical protein COA96_16975 [SAR86 cluster bacterium]
MSHTFSGTETETSAQAHTFTAPRPVEIIVYNDGPDDLIVGCGEVIGSSEHPIKAGESHPFGNLKGDIQSFTTRVASGESAAFRAAASVVKDVSGGGGAT